MSSVAAEYNAINLGQGFPDFQMDPVLTDLVAKAMKDGYNQYTHMNGFPALRERISEKLRISYNQNYDPAASITVTPGGTYAIYTALTTILQKGDEVIVFEPAYDSYIPNIEINGAIAVAVQMEYPEYQINWEVVKSKINERTKAIIINTPHNPTGAVISEQDIEHLREITRNKNIFIISDEVYEHLIFEGKQHFSLLRYPDLMEKAFVCFSFG